MAEPPARMPSAHRVVFRHELAGAALLAWVALAAAVLATAAPADRPALVCGAAGGALALFAAGWWPSVAVDDAGVTIVNPWTTLRIGWAQVRDVRMGWLLTITTDDGAHRAWAVPGPRRMRTMWERHETEYGKWMERHSLDAVASASARGEGGLGLGDAALLVAQRHAAQAALCRPAPIVRSPSRLSRCLLVAAAVLVVAAAVAVQLAS